MVEPHKAHRKPSGHVLKYLNGTIRYGMQYIGNGKQLLHGFVDS